MAAGRVAGHVVTERVEPQTLVFGSAVVPYPSSGALPLLTKGDGLVMHEPRLNWAFGAAADAVSLGRPAPRSVVLRSDVRRPYKGQGRTVTEATYGTSSQRQSSGRGAHPSLTVVLTSRAAK